MLPMNRFLDAPMNLRDGQRNVVKSILRGTGYARGRI
jgi:hypothetical protein